MGAVKIILEKAPIPAMEPRALIPVLCWASMHRSSAATVGCEQDMCLRVSDVSGLAVSTLRGHVDKVLCGHEVRPGAISAVDMHLDQSIVTTGKRKTLG